MWLCVMWIGMVLSGPALPAPLGLYPVWRGQGPRTSFCVRCCGLVETIFSLVVLFENRQNVPNTLTDTPELQDTLPDTVLVTF